MSECSIGLNSNYKSTTGWRWMNMMHKMYKPPPMDLSSERLILTLKISPSKQTLQPLTANGHINNTIILKIYIHIA